MKGHEKESFLKQERNNTKFRTSLGQLQQKKNEYLIGTNLTINLPFKTKLPPEGKIILNSFINVM